ncbi:basic proline-rich protein-like [Sarcophilus harrisii]|uniref:basic proline-rich protein-like n=1 Tax=Sarcophilus harrisii TaxID=9305 RepID=UPI001301FF97|nr:basic proline-rich protein-like [Sarcophilus harrisii]
MRSGGAGARGRGAAGGGSRVRVPVGAAAGRGVRAGHPPPLPCAPASRARPGLRPPPPACPRRPCGRGRGRAGPAGGKVPEAFLPAGARAGGGRGARSRGGGGGGVSPSPCPLPLPRARAGMPPLRLFQPGRPRPPPARRPGLPGGEGPCSPPPPPSGRRGAPGTLGEGRAGLGTCGGGGRLPGGPGCGGQAARRRAAPTPGPPPGLPGLLPGTGGKAPRRPPPRASLTRPGSGPPPPGSAGSRLGAALGGSRRPPPCEGRGLAVPTETPRSASDEPPAVPPSPRPHFSGPFSSPRAGLGGAPAPGPPKPLAPLSRPLRPRGCSCLGPVGRSLWEPALCSPGLPASCLPGLQPLRGVRGRAGASLGERVTASARAGFFRLGALAPCPPPPRFRAWPGPPPGPGPSSRTRALLPDPGPPPGPGPSSRTRALLPDPGPLGSGRSCWGPAGPGLSPVSGSRSTLRVTEQQHCRALPLASASDPTCPPAQDVPRAQPPAQPPEPPSG